MLALIQLKNAIIYVHQLRNIEYLSGEDALELKRNVIDSSLYFSFFVIFLDLMHIDKCRISIVGQYYST